VLTTVLAAGCAPSLAVPPHLVASWPVAGARLSVSRHVLELTFNRALAADATRASVVTAENGTPMVTDVGLDPADAHRLQVRLHEPAPGTFDLRWHAVAADSGLASDGEQPFSLVAETPAPPRLDVAPPTADAKERLELVGKGFAANAAVRLMIGDNQQALATTRADAQGKFNLEARVPEAVPLGMQPVVAVDDAGRVASTALEVRWGGWPPVVATNVGAPGPLPGQLSITLSVRNLSDYTLEHVLVILQDPDGASPVSADSAARREGNTLVWELPVLDRGPAGPFHATYRAEHPAVSHAWIDYRHRQQRGCSEDRCLPAFLSNSVADSALVAPAD
jgi:methionine-rich copper-binding protein CopC